MKDCLSIIYHNDGSSRCQDTRTLVQELSNTRLLGIDRSKRLHFLGMERSLVLANIFVEVLLKVETRTLINDSQAISFNHFGGWRRARKTRQRLSRKKPGLVLEL